MPLNAGVQVVVKVVEMQAQGGRDEETVDGVDPAVAKPALADPVGAMSVLAVPVVVVPIAVMPFPADPVVEARIVGTLASADQDVVLPIEEMEFLVVGM